MCLSLIIFTFVKILHLNLLNLYTFLQTAPLFRVFLMLMAGGFSGEFFFSSRSPVLLLAMLAAVLAAAFAVRRSGTVQSSMLLFAVYLTGLCTYRISVSDTCVAESGHYDYSAVVSGGIKRNRGFSTFDMIKTDGGSEHKLRATIRGNVELRPGDRLHVRSVINPPEDRHEGRFSYAAYLIRNGYWGTTFLRHGDIESEGCRYDDLAAFTRFKIYLMRLRSSLLEQLHDRGLKGRDFAAVSAMVFGDKTYLTTDDREMYSRTGVSHILALSGLHIGIVYAFLTFFLTFIPKVPRFAAIQAAVWFYVIFAGMSPSLLRAALMITVYSAGTLMHRDKLSLNSLSLAGTVSVLFSPQIIFDLCFQLSFMSVFSIILFYRPLESMLPSRPPLLRKMMQMTAVSVAAYTGTLPIILYNFGSMSYCFILTNLVVIPLTTAVIYLSIISFLPFVGTYVTTALVCAIHMLNTFVEFMSRISFISNENMYISLFTFILTYIVIFSIYLIYCKLHFSKKVANISKLD